MANAIWDPAKGTYVPASPQAKAQAEKVYSNNTGQPRAVWNTNTGKYEPITEPLRWDSITNKWVKLNPTPKAIWNPVESKYVPVDSIKAPKYTVSEAMALAQYGYTGLYKAGTKQGIGLLGNAWQQQKALWDLQMGKPIEQYHPYINPDDLYGSRYDLAAKPLTKGFLNNFYNLQTRFADRYGSDGAKYASQYGHLPTADSKYGMLFQAANRKIRNDAAMSNYQNILAAEMLNVGKAYVTHGGDNPTVKSSGAMLIDNAIRYKSKKGKWDPEAIADMEATLGIQGGMKKYTPEVLQALGVNPPNDHSSALAAMSLMNGSAGSTLANNNIAYQAIGKMEAAANSGLLKAEKVNTDNPLDFVGGIFANTVRGLSRVALGLPLGIYAIGEMTKNTVENMASGKWSGTDIHFGVDTRMLSAVKDDYVRRYKTPFDSGFFNPSSWAKFGEIVAEDPTAPILDALSIVPVVGWGLKGADAVSMMGRFGKVGEVGGLTERTALDAAKAQEYASRVESGRVKVYTPEEAAVAKEQLAADKALRDQARREAAGEVIPQGERVRGAQLGSLRQEVRRTLSDTERYNSALDMIDEANAAKAMLSPRKYRQLARKALVGDVTALEAIDRYRRLGLVIPGTEEAGFLLKASAKFEERMKVLDNPRAVGTLAAGDVVAITRLPASPLARGISEGLTFIRRAAYNKLSDAIIEGEAGPRATKYAEMLVDLPLVGYRWQYTRAQASSARYFWQDSATDVRHAKELLTLATESNISEPMSRAILSRLNGGDGTSAFGHYNDPAYQRTIWNAKQAELDARVASGEISPTSEVFVSEQARIDAQLKNLPDPAHFEDAVKRLNEKMDNPEKIMDAETEAAFKIHGQLQHQRDRVSRLTHAATTPHTMEYLKMMFAETMQALRLRDTHLFGPAGELTPFLSRMIKVNDNFPIHEGQFNGAESWRYVLDTSKNDGSSVFDSIANPATKQARIDDFTSFMDDIQQSGVFRDASGEADVHGAPILVKAKGAKKNARFIPVHIVRLDGGVNAGVATRKALVNTDRVYYLPRELFHNKTVPMDDAKLFFEHGSLNAMGDIFPNPHYYSDKVSETGLNGERANFTDLKNEHVIATNGLKQHTLRMQIQSQIHFLRNRIERDLEDVANANAIIMPMDKVVGGQVRGRVLKSVRLFDDPIKAEEFAKLRGVHKEFLDTYAKEQQTPGATLVDSPFDVNTGFGIVERDGQRFYAVRGDVRDWSAYAMQDTAAKLKNVDMYQQILYDDLKDVTDASGTWALVVPNHIDHALKQTIVEGNDYASKLLEKPMIKGPTNIFKRLVLNMNPRFISTNLMGGLVMLTMHNPMNSVKLLTKAMQASAKRSGTKEWYALSQDLDVLHHHMAYEFDHNIYKSDMGASSVDDAQKMGKFKKYGWNFGYTTVRMFEEFVRKAVAKDFLENDPAFRAFMDGPEVKRYIDNGIDFRGDRREDITKFEAASDMLLDPASQFYKHDLKMRMRYTTNTVSGNYHHFSAAEQVFRNLLMPFYAWQRHSLAFTWRMPIDRPITSNVIANTGMYGYTQALSTGLPSWMYQTVPMPDFIRQAFGIENSDYRLDLSSISPFGATADLAQATHNLLQNGNVGSNIFQFTNPLINTTIKSVLHVDPTTGIPVQPQDQSGVLGTLKDTMLTLPGIRIPKSLVWDSLNGAYEQDALAYRYKQVDNASDVFRNYTADKQDTAWHLSVPKETINIRPASFGGALMNAFFPLKPYDINANRMSDVAQREAVAAGVLNVVQQKSDATTADKFVNGVQAWQAKRDYIMRVWLPQAQKQLSPEEIQLVLIKLMNERPEAPKGLSFNNTLQMLGG